MYILFLLGLSTVFSVNGAAQVCEKSGEIATIGVIYSQETGYFGEGSHYRGNRRSPFAWLNLRKELITLFERSQKHSNPANYFASRVLQYVDNSLWQKVHTKKRSKDDLREYLKKKNKLLAVHERYIAVKKRSDEIRCDMITALFEQGGTPLVAGPDANPDALPEKVPAEYYKDSSATPSSASSCSLFDDF